MTGKYQTYSKYDAAGDDCWFGCVPSHWEVKKISYVAQLKSGDSIVSEQIEAEGDYPVYGGNGHRGYTSKFNHEGDYILIGRQGALCGNINYASGQFWASEHAVVVHPTVKVSLKWLGETLRAMDLNQYNVSAAQPGLAVANITCLKIPYPNIVEQENIASFLDHETAKIDTLIDKQQQLIQLLKEKRQAVISHAVTKGLSPNAPMRDSGVEWLGEVPEHWEQVKLKYIVKNIIDAEHKTAEYFDDGEYLVCRTTNVRDGQLVLEGGKYTNLETYTEWIKRGKPEAGDILFTREAPAGEACVYWGDVPLCLGQRMVLFKLKTDRALSLFVLHSLYSGLADSFIKQLSQGSTVAHFNMADIRNIPLFEPPMEEQSEINNYLSNILSKYDDLMRDVTDAIELLQERRTALISAAVTGKIDVRQHVSRPAGNDTNG